MVIVTTTTTTVVFAHVCYCSFLNRRGKRDNRAGGISRRSWPICSGSVGRSLVVVLLLLLLLWLLLPATVWFSLWPLLLGADNSRSAAAAEEGAGGTLMESKHSLNTLRNTIPRSDKMRGACSCKASAISLKKKKKTSTDKEWVMVCRGMWVWCMGRDSNDNKLTCLLFVACWQWY